MDQYYRIADLTVKMDAMARTAEQAQPYQIAPCSDVDIVIESDWNMLKYEHLFVSDITCEYLATGREFYRKLLDFDGMMLHASAIAIDGKAYLFSADSGTGKSTHVNLYRQVFGDERVRIINDDKPALRMRDGKWYVYGTPWSGKYALSLNLCYPLAGICFLERSRINKIEHYVKNDLIFQIMKQTIRPEDEQGTLKLMSLVDCLLARVPIWRLQCNMEREAALLSYQTMVFAEKQGD